jgi:hypothetical protein
MQCQTGYWLSVWVDRMEVDGDRDEARGEENPLIMYFCFHLSSVVIF